MKQYTKTKISCEICTKEQVFCNNGMTLSGLCTSCRKKKHRADNKPLIKAKPNCSGCSLYGPKTICQKVLK